MLRKFLVRGLTAHGISHVMTEKSAFRRIMWICALIATSATMLLMTYNVLQEYLKYPLVRYTKRMSFNQLDFPAVTVCGYSLIPSHNVKEANLRFLEELEQALGSLPEYGVDHMSKNQCIKDPLCRWSRFSDECYCSQKVCASTECYPIKNDTYCACSKALCSPSVPNITSACSVVVHEGKKQCLCRKDFVYPKYDNKSNSRLTPDFLEALKHLDPSPEVKELLQRIKNSTDTCLRDIETYLRPNITTLDNYGLAVESLVLSCTFATHPCSVKYDITTLYSPTYGKCYMFNYAGENEKQAGLKVVNNYGQTHGLELYLKAPKANTVPLLAPQYGARVVIHDPRSLPFASQKGFDIRAGDLTSVVLKMRLTQRLGPPWSDCAWDGDNRTSNYLEIPYSKLGCERKCLNDLMYKNCNCYNMRLLSGSVSPKRQFLCGSKEENCIRKIIVQFFQNGVTCKCPQPCRHKSYDTDISASKINQEFFRFTKTARSLKLINGTPAVSDPSFNLGMMGLQVYFNSFNVMTITETSIYSWEFLVSNIGGNMGLFLGLSLITFVEVAEFIFDIFVQTFCRRRRSHRSVDSNLQTNEYTIKNINVQFKHNRAKLKVLSKDFIAKKISAAGVSYIVDDKSRLRRFLWFFGIVGTFLFMGYMTLNVLLEYLNFPKMLIIEDEILPRLPFPAVTLCSLNPFSERYAAETSMKRYVKLRELFNEMFPLEPQLKLRLNCVKEPLCKWSWFLEACECAENPCHTEFCITSNESYCICSSTICKKSEFACSRLDDSSTTWNKNLCLCDSNEIYKPPVPKVKQQKLDDILSHVNDEDVQTIIRLVWNSKSYDLSDVEEGLMPTLDEIYKYGIPFDSFVASCTFEQNRCSRENFTILYHPKYGRCYMFNYAGGSSADPTQPIDTNNYGSNTGLNLLLLVPDQDSLDLVRREVGARIVIHDPYQLPFVSEYGVNVKPSDMTAVAVSMTTMNRLPKPWGNCLYPELDGSETESYSILGCEKKCGFSYMAKKCNCTMRHLMHGSVLAKNTTKYPLCDLSNQYQKICVERTIQELEDKVHDCKCIPPCNETIYNFAVTSSELNENYFRMVKAIRTLRVMDDKRLSYIKTTDRKSMIGVKVYYNTFQVSRQSEVKSYSWETLVANVGGNLGFFLGLTLITFLEIVEFLWDVLCTAFKPPAENKVYTVPNKPSRVFSRSLHKERGHSHFRRKTM